MLLDLRMQDMDGMEVLRRTKDLNRNLPVIVLTGYHDTQEAVNALKAGAYECLTVPFESGELTERYARHFPKGHPNESSARFGTGWWRAIP